MNVEIGTREAVALLVLFVSQVVAEFYVIQTYAEPTFTNISILILYASTTVYIVLGVGLFVKRYGSLRKLIEHTASNVRTRAVVTSAGSNTHD